MLSCLHHTDPNWMHTRRTVADEFVFLHIFNSRRSARFAGVLFLVWLETMGNNENANISLTKKSVVIVLEPCTIYSP